MDIPSGYPLPSHAEAGVTPLQSPQYPMRSSFAAAVASGFTLS
jgi:hypothetical protein